MERPRRGGACMIGVLDSWSLTSPYESHEPKHSSKILCKPTQGEGRRTLGGRGVSLLSTPLKEGGGGRGVPWSHACAQKGRGRGRCAVAVLLHTPDPQRLAAAPLLGRGVAHLCRTRCTQSPQCAQCTEGRCTHGAAATVWVVHTGRVALLVPTRKTARQKLKRMIQTTTASAVPSST